MLNKYKVLLQEKPNTSSKKLLSKTELKSSAKNTKEKSPNNLVIKLKGSSYKKACVPKENYKKYHRGSVDLLVKSEDTSGKTSTKSITVNKAFDNSLRGKYDMKTAHCTRVSASADRNKEKNINEVCKDSSNFINTSIRQKNFYDTTHIKKLLDKESVRRKERGLSANIKKTKLEGKPSGSKASLSKQIMRNLEVFAKDRKRIIESNKAWFKESKEIPKTGLDYYSSVKLIGKGAFGKVILGIHKLTGKYVAIKTIEKKFMQDELSRRKVFQEVYILKKIRHANVIRLLEVFEDTEHILIVMEYAAGGDLLKYVRANGAFNETHAREIFRQIVYGLGHIHARSVLHRDIKLDNILIDANGGVKICDFGVSKIIAKDDVIKEQCGTPAYIAPEVISNEGYQGFYIDHWSLGVLLYAMLTANVPFKAKNMEELLEVIKTKRVAFPIKISEYAMDLIRSLLKLNPTERLSIPEILNHPWMQGDNEEFCENNSSVYVNSKDCKDENIVPSINTVNMKNLFFRGPNIEKLSYVDYCIMENDMYTHRIDEGALRKMEEFGYPGNVVIEVLEKGVLNHAVATYNLLVLP